MESNSLLLGRIPSNGSGLNKTYLESTFVCINISGFYELYSSDYNNRKKLYFDTEQNKIVFSANPTRYKKELEVLSVIPISSERLFIEVIQKDILLKHLQDERMMIEEMNNNTKLVMEDRNGK